MLVYGTRLWLSPATVISEPLDVLGRWLSRKVARHISAERLLAGMDASYTGAHRIQSVATVDAFPNVVATSYTHPDAQVSGRQWLTEVGFRIGSAGADVECTVLLSTSEISPRVASPVLVSRPGVVTELVARCELAVATQGVSVHYLDEDSAEAFRYVVLDSRRQHSLLVLSADHAGNYLSDPEHLRSLVLGLADVVVMRPGTDTRWLSHVIGRDYIPYNGALKLLYPYAHIGDRAFVATRLITRETAAELSASGQTVDTEVLSLITHRSNLPIAWSHVSIQAARDLQLQRELARRREEAARTGDTAEYAKFLEETVAELEDKVRKHEGSLESLERVVSAQEDTERQLHYQNDVLKHQLAEAGGSARKSDEDGEDRAEVVLALAQAIDTQPTPMQSLLLIMHLFPERVEILPDAWKSARDSEKFRYGRKLFSLLLALVTEYWDGLASGRPDAEARKVFGAAYGAQESDTTAKNKGARTKRTFAYRGQPVAMMSHIKIGIKDSIAETIRVHFEWFPQERVIVIGHCGAHLDFY